MMNEPMNDHNRRMAALFRAVDDDPGPLAYDDPPSYHAANVAWLGQWLERRGWTHHDPQSVHEVARYTTDRDQEIVLYLYGGVRVLGNHTDDTHKLLAPLVARPEVRR